MSDWKQALYTLLEGHPSDSDIEDFATDHPDIDGKLIWDEVYEYDAPKECKRCVYIQHTNMHPCDRCSRRVTVKDYYKER